MRIEIVEKIGIEKLNLAELKNVTAAFIKLLTNYL
jgi:hypothetical protein